MPQNLFSSAEKLSVTQKQQQRKMFASLILRPGFDALA